MNNKLPADNPREAVGFTSPARAASIFRLFLGFALGVYLGAVHAAPAPVQDLDSLSEAVHGFLMDKAADQSGAGVRVTVDPIDSRLRLPACSQVLEPFLAPAARLIGATSVGVACAAPKPWKVYLQASVAVWQPVVVSARALPRHALIGAGDLRVRDTDLGTLTSGYFGAEPELLGMQLERSLIPGQVISPNMLRRPLIIRRGDPVTLVSSGGNLEVRAAGRALADGTIGQRIAVQSGMAKRRLDGEVIAPGVVRMSGSQ